MIDGADGTSWGIGDAGILRLPTRDLARALRGRAARRCPKSLIFATGKQLRAKGPRRAGGARRRRAGVVPHPPQRAFDRPRAPAFQPHCAAPGAARHPRGRARDGALPGMALDAGTMAVDILFTAPSMTMPDRLRFRYRLVGSGAGNPITGSIRGGGAALLRDLGPGAYRFELLVANEDGVWAPSPLVFDFSIRPAWYQRWWFWALGGAVVLGLLYAAYLARIRYVTEQIHERISERTRERERIARELHDTLIQSVQGLILIFHSAAQRLSHHPEAADLLLPAVDRAESVLVEGRDQLQGLRRMDDLHLHDELLRMLDADPIVARHPVALTRGGTGDRHPRRHPRSGGNRRRGAAQRRAARAGWHDRTGGGLSPPRTGAAHQRRWHRHRTRRVGRGRADRALWPAGDARKGGPDRRPAQPAGRGGRRHHDHAAPARAPGLQRAFGRWLPSLEQARGRHAGQRVSGAACRAGDDPVARRAHIARFDLDGQPLAVAGAIHLLGAADRLAAHAAVGQRQARHLHRRFQHLAHDARGGAFFRRITARRS
jgi:hypothetical protein